LVNADEHLLRGSAIWRPLRKDSLLFAIDLTVKTDHLFFDDKLPKGSLFLARLRLQPARVE
jgi:hypothetical protein